MKNFFRVLVLVFSANLMVAQQWVESMQDPSVNFYEVQNQFETYWKATERQAQKTNQNFRPGKSGYGHGWVQFRRWENFWEPRVYPSGERPSQELVYTEMTNALNTTALNNLGQWTALGPNNAPSNDGIGRVNCIEFDPINTDIVWAGTPAGGLWKSTDGGLTWSTNTDNLVNLGVASIAIDPNHPDTMYIASGDRNASDTYSYGVMKSVDGGKTWLPTGLTYGVNQNVRVGAVHVFSTNSQIVLAATRNGMLRSMDGGATWSGVQSGVFNALAPDPSNPNTIFAATSGTTTRIYRSRDTGATWTLLTTGLPLSGINRVEVAVSPQDSNYVYAVYSATNNGFHGLYRSTDAGTTWSMRSSSPNILGWNSNGSGTGGQGWYDLCIAVSPSNKDRIFVGGVNIWRSNNGGNTWVCVAHWTGNGAPFVHADIHYFKFKPNSDVMYAGTDGGVSRTANNGISWDNLYDNMNITQYYKISNSATNPNVILGGAQDNGTHRLLGSNWTRVGGGDGMDNAIDPTDNLIMYSSIYYGSFRKSVNGGNNFFSMTIGAAGTGNWVTPFRIDPVNSNILYAGYDRLWKSTDKGSTWAATSSSPINGTNIDELAVAPSNNQIIYVAINDDLFRSTNGGSTWTLISQSLLGTNHITGIAINPSNADHIWVTRSGYSNNQKVFESTNAGQSWINLSNGLPNLPVNCVIYENASLDGVYIGTDVGVYYRNATLNNWVPFFNGLPNVIVRDLEIFYPTGKLRAGTYGRGVWESPLYSNLQEQPIADFRVAPGSVCNQNDTITLVDLSQNIPTSWKWDIYPANHTFVNGTTDSSRFPQVVFSATGEYTVTLKASNLYGSDNKTMVRAIAVGGKSLPFTEDFEDNMWMEEWTINNPDNSFTWENSAVGGSQTGSNAAEIDFYSYQNVGEKDDLISPPLSFNGYSNINLSFQHAYRRYNNNSSDSLKVYISTDCGTTWTLLQGYGENGTGNWATGSSLNTPFVPAAAGDWCFGNTPANCKTINLNAFSGNNNVRIKFESISGFGNKLYLDNINITGTPTNAPVANFVSDTTGCAAKSYHFYDVSTNNPTSLNWQFIGGSPSTSTQANPIVNYNTPGTYSVRLIATNALGSDTIIKSVGVLPAVTAAVNLTANSTSICVNQSITITANLTNAGSNPTILWYVNGGFRTVGGTSLTIYNAQNNDQVRCVLRPDIACVLNDSVVSNLVTITVLPVPQVAVSPYPQMCASDAPLTLTGGTPAGGAYSGNGVTNGVFDPVAAGVGGHVITYTYTAANGCVGSATSSISVNNSPPKPTVSYSNFVLKASPISSSYTYQWLDAQGNPLPGASDTVFIPTTTGNYAVRIAMLNGCTNTSDFITVNQIGLNEYTLTTGIKTYPNPVRNELHAEFVLTMRTDLTVRILDMTGRTVYIQNTKMNAGEQKLNMNTQNLAPGAYILELNNGENAIQQRFIKQ